MSYIIEYEGPAALFKGIGPQILKGILVQGLLMLIKERCVLLALKVRVLIFLIAILETEWKAYFVYFLPTSVVFARPSCSGWFQLPLAMLCR